MMCTSIRGVLNAESDANRLRVVLAKRIDAVAHSVLVEHVGPARNSNRASATARNANIVPPLTPDSAAARVLV